MAEEPKIIKQDNTQQSRPNPAPNYDLPMTLIKMGGIISVLGLSLIIYTSISGPFMYSVESGLSGAVVALFGGRLYSTATLWSGAVVALIGAIYYLIKQEAYKKQKAVVFLRYEKVIAKICRIVGMIIIALQIANFIKIYIDGHLGSEYNGMNGMGQQLHTTDSRQLSMIVGKRYLAQITDTN
jgi:hypothetical protein